MRRPVRIAIASAAVGLLASAALALELGDEAPELELTNWVQGQPVSIAAGKGQTIFVIQFWHTLEAGSRDAAGELSDFQDEFGEKGVQCIGVTQQGPTTMKEFLADKSWNHRVACDEDKNTSYAYMAGTQRLPFTFVIDKSGVLAWKGQNTQQMRSVVKQVIDGTYDVEKTKKLEELNAELRKHMWDFFGENADEAIAAAKKVLEVDPVNFFAYSMLRSKLMQKGEPKAFKDFCRAHFGKVKDDADFLRNMADSLVDGSFDWRDVEFALEAVSVALDLTKGEDMRVLETHGRIHFELGMLEQAIATQKKVVAIHTKKREEREKKEAEEREKKRAAGEEVEEPERKERGLSGREKRLAYYEHCLKVRKRLEKKEARKTR